MRGGLVKVLAKNHQYLGVNNAIEALHEIERPAGPTRGLLAHPGQRQELFDGLLLPEGAAQGAGQLDVRDRHGPQELDDQIYKTFADAGAVTEGEVRADSGEDLKRLLTEDHRYVFTLIQKFHTDRGETYPVLSERSDIVVITDEAHRSQYDLFALNMRNALPNARSSASPARR